MIACAGIGAGYLQDDADLSTMGITAGLYCILQEQNPDPPPPRVQPAAQQRSGAYTRDMQQFVQRLSGTCETVLMYEDHDLQAKALSKIPLEKLEQRGETPLLLSITPTSAMSPHAACAVRPCMRWGALWAPGGVSVAGLDTENTDD